MKKSLTAVLFCASFFAAALYADHDLPVNGHFRSASSGVRGWRAVNAELTTTLEAGEDDEFNALIKSAENRQGELHSDIFPLYGNRLELEFDVFGNSSGEAGYIIYDKDRKMIGVPVTRHFGNLYGKKEVKMKFSITDNNAKYISLIFRTDNNASLKIGDVDAEVDQRFR